MKPPADPKPRALFLSPEVPSPGSGGGGLRSASLLQYLQTKYSVDVAGFQLRRHSKAPAARTWRNFARLVRGVPPLFDRYSGYEAQLQEQIGDARYALAVVEHFWCASYAALLRPHCERLVIDLHNIESALAETHAQAARWPVSWASLRFAAAYRRLERIWLPRFDTVLVTSEPDRKRIGHPRVFVYPNALPEIRPPQVKEEECLVFSGNLEYHPNIEAVRWFRTEIWPRVRERCGEWRLVGKNPEAIAQLVSGDERIRLLGPVEDAVTEIARAKICVVPLRSGSGTRFKILEAWAAARAVVSTPLGAEGLGARPGEHLLIADTAEEFVLAIERLCADAALRDRLGAAGRAHYLRRFTWPVAWRCLRL